MKMAAAQIETFPRGTSLCPGDESWQPPHVKSVRQVKRMKDKLYVGAAASSQGKTNQTTPPKHPNRPTTNLQFESPKPKQNIQQRGPNTQETNNNQIPPTIEVHCFPMLFYHSGLTGVPQVHLVCTHFCWFLKSEDQFVFATEIVNTLNSSAEQTVSITKALDGVREIYDDFNAAFEKWSGVPLGQAPVE